MIITPLYVPIGISVYSKLVVYTVAIAATLILQFLASDRLLIQVDVLTLEG